MFLILIPVLCAWGVTASPARYDQRQTGEENYRVNVEDVVIVGVLDGELGGDYEYNYDYSDLTVKPEEHFPVSTPLPTSTTDASSTATSTSTTPQVNNNNNNGSLILETDNHTLTISPSKPGNTSSEPNKLSLVHPLNTQDLQIPVVIVQADELKKPEKLYVSSSTIRKKTQAGVGDPQDLPPRHCSEGFFLDSKNRCKRVKRPLLRERPKLPFGLRYPQRPQELATLPENVKALELPI